jgi:polar amino acid transport system permease protein/cystine transport system permease protein
MAQTYQNIISALLEATYTTLGITVGAFILAIIAGFIVAVTRLYGPSWLKAVFAAFVEVMRNTPILVQLFVLYFGLAQLGIHMSPILAAVLGLGMNGAALLSEVFRTSINAVDPGQSEAGQAIGFTPDRAFFNIVLLQASRIAMPSIGNFAVSLIKDTSLASAVAVPELAFRARTLVSETFLSSEIYLLVALIYFGLSFPAAWYFKSLERAVTPGGGDA